MFAAFAKPAAVERPGTGALVLTSEQAQALWGAVLCARRQTNLPSKVAEALNQVEPQLLNLYVQLGDAKGTQTVNADQSKSELLGHGVTA